MTEWNLATPHRVPAMADSIVNHRNRQEADEVGANDLEGHGRDRRMPGKSIGSTRKTPRQGGAEVEENVQNRRCVIGTESAAF